MIIKTLNPFSYKKNHRKFWNSLKRLSLLQCYQTFWIMAGLNGFRLRQTNRIIGLQYIANSIDDLELFDFENFDQPLELCSLLF